MLDAVLVGLNGDGREKSAGQCGRGAEREGRVPFPSQGVLLGERCWERSQSYDHCCVAGHNMSMGVIPIGPRYRVGDRESRRHVRENTIVKTGHTIREPDLAHRIPADPCQDK
ncbi:hypothetical protein GCM10027590_41850 [Nocardiopsis nanhaiensis]